MQSKELFVEFVATNDDPSFITGASGRQMPDVGATLAALETAAGRKAQRVGKPDKYALGVILRDQYGEEGADKVDKSRVCYVGDNIATDVYFSKNSGIGSVLVLSGLAKLEKDAEDIRKAQPDFILEKFA